jgi:hypothetical protein
VLGLKLKTHHHRNEPLADLANERAAELELAPVPPFLPDSFTSSDQADVVDFVFFESRVAVSLSDTV